MIRRRIDAASQFVVFREIPGPFQHMRNRNEAFGLILARCDYEAVWTVTPETVTLQFRRAGSPADAPMAPEQFAMENRWGEHGCKVLLIGELFKTGLKGWFALPWDMFTVQHSIAWHKARV